jgi:excinuclease ABC subunit A
MIQKMKIRGAKVHNLKNIDVDIPLNQIVGIASVSGSGKSSLALETLNDIKNAPESCTGKYL